MMFELFEGFFTNINTGAITGGSPPRQGKPERRSKRPLTAKKIAKCRKRILSSNYTYKRKKKLNANISFWTQRGKDLENFIIFKCDSFFVGEAAAKANKKRIKGHEKELEKNLDRLSKKLEWYERN